jgi:WD40 repeat protein
MVTSRRSTWTQSDIVLEGHTEQVNCVALSPDGSCIVSCSSDRTVRVWDASSGEQRAVLDVLGVYPYSFFAAAFNLDGSKVAAGARPMYRGLFGKNFPTMVWDLSTGLPTTISRFCDDDSTITGQRDQALWQRLLMGRSCRVSSPDGSRVIFGSPDGTIRIQDMKSRQLDSSSSRAPIVSRQKSVDVTHLSRDSSRLTCTFHNGLIEVYDTNSGAVLASLKQWLVVSEAVYHPNRFCLSMSPDSLRLALYDTAGGACVYIWDLQAHSLLTCSSTRPDADELSSNKVINPLIWSPDGMRCAVRVVGQRLHIWNAITGILEADLGFSDLSGPGESRVLHHAEFLPDGRHVLSVFWENIYCDQQQRICMYNTDDWSLDSANIPLNWGYSRDPVHMPFTEASVISPKGTHMVMYQRAEGWLYLLSIKHDENIANIVNAIPYAQVQEVVWSCDGSQVALTDKNEVFVWSTIWTTAEGHLSMSFRGYMWPTMTNQMNPKFSPLSLLRFSRDGRRCFARDSTGEKHLWGNASFETVTLDAQVSAPATEAPSVDIVVSGHSGWLLCSRADRAELVHLLWVPPQCRWDEARSVHVAGRKVAYRNAVGGRVTILNFPSLQDLYRMT